MATKKQKRAVALAKREKFLEEVKTQGLRAQEWARQKTEAKHKIIRTAEIEIEEYLAEQNVSSLESFSEPTMEDINKLAMALYIGD